MFVSFRLLVVESILTAWTSASMIMYSVKAARFDDFEPPRFYKRRPECRPASINDATTRVDQKAVVLFTIDRLARSPRTTVR